jgi:hypothetical protein
MTKERYNQSVRDADKAFVSWCEENAIPLYKIEHVITWEDWDDGIGVYFFLPNMTDVENLRPKQSDEMKHMYLKLLNDSGYPFVKFPNVSIEIDSDENVRKNYSGSYFYRLR